MENIYFYLSQDDLHPDEIPKSMDVLDVNSYVRLRTKCSWTLQTYLRLKAENFFCILSGVMPEEGIVLAFRGSRRDYIHKPNSKLYNAWHAGVPAILGHESAYQAERRSELDYIEVTSLCEVVSALKRLRDDKELRKAMVENGRIRAEETNYTNLTARWHDLIAKTVVPAYERWCAASNWTRQTFLIQRFLTLRKNGVRHRIGSFKA